MKINKEFIKQFDPCESGWKNYLKHYSDFNGTWLEFFELEKLSVDDRLWLFFRDIPEIEKQQRQFAVYCMDRCQTDKQEIIDFQTLVILMYQSVDYETNVEELKDEYYSAAYSAAARAAWAANRAARAANSAADWAADGAARAAWAANRAARAARAAWAANRAARAADWAADGAAEVKVQLEIAKYVMGNES